MMNELALTNKLIRQKRGALEKVMAQYTPYVTTVVFNACGGALTAEDMEEVVSDTFLLLWQNTHRLRPDRSVKPYLAAIARNAAKNKQRGLRPDLCLSDTLSLPDACNIEEQVAEQEQMDYVRQKISGLPDLDRDIMIRYYYEEQKVREIAQALGISVSSVKIRLYRSRNALKAALQSDAANQTEGVTADESAET
ncbi:MAG: sigma-70 family RNA polymerase sigma factor [Oscillospiraceae bacterium]|nr:sigma-70 family RNA polymerase sigma factor [Oscillospiraceae bacterium]